MSKSLKAYKLFTDLYKIIVDNNLKYELIIADPAWNHATSSNSWYSVPYKTIKFEDLIYIPLNLIRA